MMAAELRRLFDHARWADRTLGAALRGAPGTPAEAWKEYGHILGATETWLSRLEQRPSRAAVWPTDPPETLDKLCEQTHAAFATYLVGLDDGALSRVIPYTNSAGKSFENSISDILHHVALHAQYHRGKINLLLRQAGLVPAPTDYIAFLRGVPAAITGEANPR